MSYLEMDDNFINIFELATFYGKRVKLTLRNGTQRFGYFKCCDPITKSIVMVCVDDKKSELCEQAKLFIAVGHAVKAVDLLESLENTVKPEKLFEIFSIISDNQNFKNNFTEEQIGDRKNRLMAWFTLNKIPVEELGEDCLLVAYNLKLKAPFDKHHCFCDNEIVLGKIQSLIEDLPDKVE